MIIGCCGFTSTGSSAVSDYLKEFDDICAFDRKEFVLAYYPDGLEDLDYQLNCNCSKYSASVVAIARFRLFVHNYLVAGMEKMQKKELYDACEQFISAITQVKWRGYGAADYQLHNNRFARWYILKLRRIGVILERHFHLRFNYFPAHDMEFSIQPAQFLEESKIFVRKVLEIYGADLNKPVVLDQPYCGNNPGKSFKYFDDPIAIVVDRDPRDNYLFAKIFLRSKGNGRQIPTDDVRSFVEYYRRMRDNQPYKEDVRVLRVCFEDMIYRYDETTRKICEFCGLNPADRKRKIFAPELSIKNTQLYKKYTQYADDIKYIEDALRDYLFPFEDFGEVDTRGEMFYGKSPLNKS